MPKIILDTDIGSDVDDAMALLFALHSLLTTKPVFEQEQNFASSYPTGIVRR